MTNKERVQKYAKEYAIKNSEKLRVYRREWMKKWRENPENKAKERDKNRISYRKNPKQVTTKAIAEWRKNNPEKNKAHRAVFCALRNGTLFREPCEHCPEHNWDVQAHHPDYSKPLQVVWLCRKHHQLIERQKRELSTK